MINSITSVNYSVHPSSLFTTLGARGLGLPGALFRSCANKSKPTQPSDLSCQNSALQIIVLAHTISGVRSQVSAIYSQQRQTEISSATAPKDMSTCDQIFRSIITPNTKSSSVRVDRWGITYSTTSISVKPRKVVCVLPADT